MNNLLKLAIITLFAATKIWASERTEINGMLNLEDGWLLDGDNSARILGAATVQISGGSLNIEKNSVLQNFGTVIMSGDTPIIIESPGELVNYGKIDLSQVTNFSEYEGTISNENEAILVIPGIGYTGGVVPKTEPVRFLFDVLDGLEINYAGEGEGAVVGVSGSNIVITMGPGEVYGSLTDIAATTGIQFSGNTGEISLKRIGEAGSSTITLDNIFASPINAFENAGKIFDVDQTGVYGYGGSVYAYPKANLTIGFGLKGLNKALYVDPNDPAFQNLFLDGVDNSGFLSRIFIHRGNLQVLSSAPKGKIEVQDGGVIAGYGATASNKAVTMEFGGEVSAKYLSIPPYSTVTIKGQLITGSAVGT
ncbi:MAG: hypothetical protein LBI95_01365 [Holosporales bacterium]|nr:hypothetical protein [Holosporales bacterium]